MSIQTEQIVRAYEQFATAWQTNDGPTVASWFVDEGTLINPFGERADGRTAISAMYAKYFGTILRGTSTSFKIASVRPIDDAHAFVDGEQAVTAPDGTVVLNVHLAALLRREGDDWRFVDGRPYTFATMPA